MHPPFPSQSTCLHLPPLLPPPAHGGHPHQLHAYSPPSSPHPAHMLACTPLPPIIPPSTFQLTLPSPLTSPHLTSPPQHMPAHTPLAPHLTSPPQHMPAPLLPLLPPPPPPQHMGVARISCISGCICAASLVDALWHEHMSLTVTHTMSVTRSPHCVVLVEILPGAAGSGSAAATGSGAGLGAPGAGGPAHGHKFKVSERVINVHVCVGAQRKHRVGGRRHCMGMVDGGMTNAWTWWTGA